MNSGDYVRLKDLSRESLNGRIGMVYNKNHDSGRFNVSLIDGSVLALKPENLEKIQKPGQMDLAKDLILKKQHEYKEKGFQAFVKDNSREAIEGLKKLVPSGIDANTFLGIFVVLFFAMIMSHGVLKALIFVYTSFSTIVLFLPAYKSAGGGISGLKRGVDALSRRTRDIVQESTSYILPDMYAKLLVVFNLVIVIGLVFFTGGSGASSATASGSDLSYEDYRANTNLNSKLQEAFSKGYLAGSTDQDMETSFEGFLQDLDRAQESRISVEDFDSGSSSASSSILGISRIAPLVVVGKMIYDIGTESNWNPQAAFQIFQAKPIWQRIMVFFVITRMIM